MNRFQEEVLRRLQSIEEKLEAYINPAKFLSIAEKSAIITKAHATGDKKIISEALRQINGR